MSSQPRLKKSWDETAASNTLNVPSTELWHVTSIYHKYVTDAQAATRVVILQYRSGANEIGGPNQLIEYTQTASTTFEYLVGVEEGSDGLFPSGWNTQEMPPGGLWLEPGGLMKLDVTLEQSGDLWDVELDVAVYKVPRA